MGFCHFLCPCPSPEDLPDPGIEPMFHVSCPGRQVLYHNSFVVVVQSLSRVRLFATSWTVALQAFLSFTISWSLFKLMSIELVMPSTVLSFVISFSSCLQSFPASQESTLHIRWPKCWSFSLSSSSEYSGLICF